MTDMQRRGTDDREPAQPRAVLAENDVVLTPHGPGIVFTVHIDGDHGVALVRGEEPGSMRPWAFSDLTFTDGSPVRIEDPALDARRARHRAQLEAAQGSEGVDLDGGFRLVGLDTAEGHGWIVDGDGVRVAFVRARLGEDGRRRWWLQILAGGEPFNWAYPEQSGFDQPHAALRAARWTDWHVGKVAAGPVEAHQARRTVTLTLPRVRELRTAAALSSTTGEPLPMPEWVAHWRRYDLTVEQMSALARAADHAVATEPTDTVLARRRRRVLAGAADLLWFQAFDTARHLATIAEPGRPDPYAEPFAGRPENIPVVDLDDDTPNELALGDEASVADQHAGRMPASPTLPNRHVGVRPLTVPSARRTPLGLGRRPRGRAPHPRSPVARSSAHARCRAPQPDAQPGRCSFGARARASTGARSASVSGPASIPTAPRPPPRARPRGGGGWGAGRLLSGAGETHQLINIW